MENQDGSDTIHRIDLERRLAQSKRLNSESLDPITRYRLTALIAEIEAMISRIDFDDLVRRRNEAADNVATNTDPAELERLSTVLSELDTLLANTKQSLVTAV